jgi:hypothetical protein
MTAARPGLRALPDWSAVPSNSDEDRILLNSRLAFFGRVIFTLSIGFFLADARRWWDQRAKEIARLAHADRQGSGTKSGPRTVAIDFARRAAAGS